MRQSASDEIVQRVGDLVTNTHNIQERIKGAEALFQIQRSDLSFPRIEQIVINY